MLREAWSEHGSGVFVPFTLDRPWCNSLRSQADIGNWRRTSQGPSP
jgi:hypothetical protein